MKLEWDFTYIDSGFCSCVTSYGRVELTFEPDRGWRFSFYPTGWPFTSDVIEDVIQADDMFHAITLAEEML